MQLQLSDPREEWTLQRRLEMHPLVPRELLILQHLLLQPITPSPALAPTPTTAFDAAGAGAGAGDSTPMVFIGLDVPGLFDDFPAELSLAQDAMLTNGTATTGAATAGAGAEVYGAVHILEVLARELAKEPEAQVAAQLMSGERKQIVSLHSIH